MVRVDLTFPLADSGSQTESQRQQEPGVVRRRQAIFVAGQRHVGRRWALSGLVRVCLLSSRPQVRVLLGAPGEHVEIAFRHSVQGPRELPAAIAPWSNSAAGEASPGEDQRRWMTRNGRPRIGHMSEAVSVGSQSVSGKPPQRQQQRADLRSPPRNGSYRRLSG